MMRLQKNTVDESPVTIKSIRNVFDVNNLVINFAVLGMPKLASRPNSVELRSAIKAKMTWLDQSSAYRNKLRYFTVWAPQHAQVPSDIDSLSKWLLIWGIKQTTSIEGELQFEARPGGLTGKKTTRPRLTSVANPTGTIPPGY